MKLPFGRSADKDAGLAWRPMSAVAWMLAATAAVAIVAFLVTMWLLTIASSANPGTDRANSRLDAVRTGLAAGAGAGAAVTLMLAFRRQRHQEIATVLSNQDATERRITELYTKAVEQLGNDTAPVRLGGLYALERVAQDNPAHRQTIVNVICAYLRMPFSPEAPAAETEATSADPSDTWRQERQVRLTAQRILSDHLRDDRASKENSLDSPSLRFWPGIRVDLTGATLIDLGFHLVAAEEAQFTGAVFTGTTQFYGATFGAASFSGATFADDAAFSRATFLGPVEFTGAVFSSNVWFSQATFDGEANFNDAAFGAITTLYKTAFHGLAEFQGASFEWDADFAGSTFGGGGWFTGASFAIGAGFSRVVFSGDATFYEVTFGKRTNFSEASFTDGADRLPFKRSRVLAPKGDHVWPPGWGIGPDGKGGYLVVRVKSTGHSPASAKPPASPDA